MNYENYHDLSPAQSLKPATRTASADGTGVDLQGYESALVLIDVGSWTDGSHTFELQESDDDSSYSAVGSTDLLGTEPVVDGAADDDQVYKLGYLGDARYIRVITTVTGSPSTGADYSALILRGDYFRPPVS